MKRRTYSVFVKDGASWTRVTPLALVLISARRVFQGILLEGISHGLVVELRPAAEDFANQETHREDKNRLFPWLSN